MTEKRQTPRIPPFVASCRYVLEGKRVPGFMTDLSTRGGRVHCEVAPPATGTRIDLEVRMGRRPAHVRLPGRVRWGRPSARGGFVFGVSFEGVGPEEQEILDQVVADFHQRARDLG